MEAEASELCLVAEVGKGKRASQAPLLKLGLGFVSIPNPISDNAFYVLYVAYISMLAHSHLILLCRKVPAFQTFFLFFFDISACWILSLLLSGKNKWEGEHHPETGLVTAG